MEKRRKTHHYNSEKCEKGKLQRGNELDLKEEIAEQRHFQVVKSTEIRVVFPAACGTKQS